ncbi:hypothetical protein BDN70DRAFT_880670 [Pholiota conissans]|uniref:Uncharacterized protein n=1 Tax=Pholiota conissans TaxID=109636 RepID=A0A9P5Z0C8_9AGAR|nr:hypothetical protein BDN70DRAFT_880670 [Pholiota conissans]
MPVGFNVAPVRPAPISEFSRPLNRPEDLLNEQAKRLSKPEDWDCDDSPAPFLNLIQSSYNWSNFLETHSQRNGFVQTVTQAYNDHHRLIIRPDDVWIAIMSQFSIYVNKNSKQLRSHFVRHDGSKKLRVVMPGNRDAVNFGDLAVQMTEKVQENIVDPDLQRWVMPDFTTTTSNDKVVCAVMMMATMKTYFEYEMSKCGIPYVTLEGEKRDWEDIRGRIEKLEEFGEEPRKWVRLLRPILDRFVSAFDGQPDVDFWNKVSVHYSLGSGSRFLSGWITAFCVWDSEGQWQGEPRVEPVYRFGQTHHHQLREVGGVMYPNISTHKIPMGFCQVDVKVVDDYGETDCIMMSGHMATQVEGRRRDTVRPMPSWFIYSSNEPPPKESEKEGESESVLPMIKQEICTLVEENIKKPKTNYMKAFTPRFTVTVQWGSFGILTRGF